jgi:hypothetical protein
MDNNGFGEKITNLIPMREGLVRTKEVTLHNPRFLEFYNYQKFGLEKIGS